MPTELLIHRLPLGLLYVAIVVIVLLSVLSGFRLGSHVGRRRKGEDEAPIGTIIGSMIGLLGFMLAFTFGIAASRFDARKQLLLDEVSAIGTAFLRADFLPDPQRMETRRLLKNYVDVRAGALRQPEKLAQVLRDSEALHDELWSRVSALSQRTGDSELLALYVQSLNEVIDLHSMRVTVGLHYRIPETIWLALIFVTILTMAAVGFYFGISGGGSLSITVVLALAFAAVLGLIADLDSTTGGLINVSQDPMISLQETLRQQTLQTPSPPAEADGS